MPVTLLTRQFSKAVESRTITDVALMQWEVYFCQEILQLVLPHGYIAKPDLIY